MKAEDIILRIKYWQVRQYLAVLMQNISSVLLKVNRRKNTRAIIS
ncbi:hypothetical protein [Paraburkholderia phenoliruptrix]|uniref:Uncharacterized protein n=1 Tax=Paraburkholderia phenoliruptrix TaxID=252970 RepID=A0A6J5KJ90_9BURK|nr:hypothetical protein [Paraburkholderia phenoliruptrix]CAB4052995.1 hypothetical protein LMG9964_06686 [Paraburkholderia phenoliruptrix]